MRSPGTFRAKCDALLGEALNGAKLSLLVRNIACVATIRCEVYDDKRYFLKLFVASPPPPPPRIISLSTPISINSALRLRSNCDAMHTYHLYIMSESEERKKKEKNKLQIIFFLSIQKKKKIKNKKKCGDLSTSCIRNYLKRCWFPLYVTLVTRKYNFVRRVDDIYCIHIFSVFAEEQVAWISRNTKWPLLATNSLPSPDDPNIFLHFQAQYRSIRWYYCLRVFEIFIAQWYWPIAWT